MLVGAAVGLGVVLRLQSFTYPGYSLDEDLTALAVRGIQQSGLPLLPSGILNERGLAFSYLSWGAGQTFGQTLNSYRLVSLASGLLTLILAYHLATRVATRATAVYASLLLAVFPIHIAISGWARFYGLATAAYAAALVCLLPPLTAPALPPDRGQEPRRAWPFAAVGLTALTHELCFTLAGLPLLLAIASGQEGRRRRWRATLVIVLSFAVVQACLAALHFATPSQSLNPWVYQSATVGVEHVRAAAPLAPVALAGVPALVVCGLAAIVVGVGVGRRAPLFAMWCAACALLFQLGLMALGVAAAVLIRPVKTGVYARCGIAFTAMTVLFWSLHTSYATDAALNVELAGSLAQFSLGYPLHAISFFARALPVTTTLVAIAATTSLASPGDRAGAHVRVLSALLIAGLASLGVLGLPPHSRYFVVLWPMILALAIRGVEVVSTLSAGVLSQPHRLRRPGAAVLVVALALEQYAFAAAHTVIDVPRSTPPSVVARVPSEEWAEVLSAIPPGAEIATNDEIAAIYHIGRADYWLSTNERDLEQYTLFTPAGPRAVYAGARVMASREAFVELLSRPRDRPLSVVLFSSGRFDFRTYKDLTASALQNHTGVTVRVGKGIATFTLPAGPAGPPVS